MKQLLAIMLFSTIALAQLPKPGGAGGGGGTSGAPPYEATFSAATSVSVSAATHGKGVNAIVESCFDNATPRNSIVFSTGYPTVAANGDVIVAWSGSKTGACFISAGDSGGTGPTGPAGPTGATGPAGADGAAGAPGGDTWVVDETPSGTINSSNTAFTLAAAPSANRLQLYLNGVKLTPTNDYTLSGTSITMVSAPTAGSILRATYVSSSSPASSKVSYIVLPAATCNASTAANGWDTPAGNAATAPTAACNDTGSIQRPTASFSGSAVNGFEVTVPLPADWDSAAAVEFVIRYVQTAASPTGNVEWDVSTVCRAAGESWDGSFNSAQTITDAAGSQNALNDATLATLTMTGCAANEDLTIRVERDGTNDSNNDAALMLWGRLKIVRTF